MCVWPCVAVVSRCLHILRKTCCCIMHTYPAARPSMCTCSTCTVVSQSVDRVALHSPCFTREQCVTGVVSLSYLSIHICLCLSISISNSISIAVSLSVCLSLCVLCPSLCLCVCRLCVSLSLCVSVRFVSLSLCVCLFFSSLSGAAAGWGTSHCPADRPRLSAAERVHFRVNVRRRCAAQLEGGQRGAQCSSQRRKR